MAGPLVVAGAILHTDIKGVTDSKKLTAKKRDLLFDQITANATFHIESISNETIDEKGLSKAIAIGLKAIMQNIQAHTYLFDGSSCFGVEGIETLIKGDLKDTNIAAASILAKVTRDRYMLKAARTYPSYGFEGHKGYITQKHVAAIQKYGYCNIHRKSVRIKALEKTLFE